MGDVGWPPSGPDPGVPPEIPPPWRPSEPARPDTPPPARPAGQPVPMVWPAPADDDTGRRRDVLLVGTLDEGTAERLAARIMELDALDAGREIELHVAARDGDLTAALLLADVVHAATAGVVAVARGVVGGVALAPFAAARRREASAQALFSLSEPTLTPEQDVVRDLPAVAEEFRTHVAQLHRWIAEATGRDVETVAADLAAGRSLDAGEARRFGLIDHIRRTPTR